MTSSVPGRKVDLRDAHRRIALRGEMKKGIDQTLLGSRTPPDPSKMRGEAIQTLLGS